MPLLWEKSRCYGNKDVVKQAVLSLCEKLPYQPTIRCYGNHPITTGVTVTTAISALLRYDERVPLRLFLPGGLN